MRQVNLVSIISLVTFVIAFIMGITISILFYIYKPKPVTEKDANEIFLNGKRLNGFSW